MSTNRRKEVNQIQLGPLFKWLTLAVMIGGCGLLFVYVKNQQHTLGQETRKVELQIREVRSYNEVLLAKISQLSSRPALQRKLEQTMVALVPIQDNAIARLVPPATVGSDGLLRTAANERFRP